MLKLCRGLAPAQSTLIMRIIKKTKTLEYFISLARLIALLWIFPDVNKAGFDEILIVFSSLRIKIDIRESLMDVPYY